MAEDFLDGNVTPKAIGDFNFPKAIIENKVDVLAFLEILVRKKIISTEELDEIRAAVVAHMNHLYPELDLTYTTPQSLAEQAPLLEANPSPQPKIATPPAEGQENPAKQGEGQGKKDVPLYYQAPPPKFFNG